MKESLVLQGFLHEGVPLPFLGQRRDSSVAAEQPCRRRQRHDAANRGFQLAVVRVRQIGSTHGAADDQITPHQHLLAGEVIGHMPGGVPRGVDNCDLDRSDVELLIVCYMSVRTDRRDAEGEAEQPRLQIRVLRLGFIQDMEQHPGTGEPLLNNCVISEVVKMAVRQPQADEIPPALRGFGEERPGRVVGGIKKDGLLRSLIGDEETISHRNSAAVR